MWNHRVFTPFSHSAICFRDSARLLWVAVDRSLSLPCGIPRRKQRTEAPVLLLLGTGVSPSVGLLHTGRPSAFLSAALVDTSTPFSWLHAERGNRGILGHSEPELGVSDGFPERCCHPQSRLLRVSIPAAPHSHWHWVLGFRF